MFLLRFIVLATAAVAIIGNTTKPMQGVDPANDQIVLFKEKYKDPVGIMTTSSGAPISYTDASVSLNTILLNNDFLIESLTHLNRERIPERIVHAKGGGAFGYFKVTHDIRHICKAEMFSEIGMKTPIAVRFSSVQGERGSNDVTRDVRGFAVKFYTQEGNFDVVGLNTPMFLFKDPLIFPNFVHAVKKNPSTNLRDLNTFWDFMTLNPESMFSILFIFGDRGIPENYANIPGFSIHTYPVENKQGELHFVRFHFIPDDGIKSLTTEKARRVAAQDPDYYVRNLYRAIANGEFPSWTVSVQVLTLDDIKKDLYAALDISKVISLDKHPLNEVGKLILNRNAKNYFAEIEQLAFCPCNLVPGILGEPSKIFEARRFAYRDAHYYRLGANFNKILVNCPYRTKTLTYNRDGVPPVKENEGDIPNYYPNSFNGPVPYMNTQKSQMINIIENPERNNFEQATELYINEMTTDERSIMISNIVCSLKLSSIMSQKRAVVIFDKIHPDLGHRVAQGLKVNQTCGRL